MGALPELGEGEGSSGGEAGGLLKEHEQLMMQQGGGEGQEQFIKGETVLEMQAILKD